MNYEKNNNGILYSTDKNLLQTGVIHKYLSEESYWAKDIPLQIVEASIKGSVCFAAYSEGIQVAFARLITDEATFAYLADVFVLPDHRGKGVSKELMQFIMDYPGCRDLRRIMLATRDAHGLYSQYGFIVLTEPERIMEIKFFQNYSDR